MFNENMDFLSPAHKLLSSNARKSQAWCNEWAKLP